MPSLKIRRDSKRRVLHTGESVRANGKYQFKYVVNGKAKFLYSWRLTPTDPQLPGSFRVYPSGSLRKALTGIWNHGLILHAGISRSMSLLRGILRPEQVSENRHVSVTILSVICLRMRNSETGRCVR